MILLNILPKAIIFQGCDAKKQNTFGSGQSRFKLSQTWLGLDTNMLSGLVSVMVG